MQTPSDRLHALDAVRAFALLLGVLLHAIVGFMEGFPPPYWKDSQSSTSAFIIAFSIHMFRMALFYLMAGFFARLLVTRRGVFGFVRDRGMRVAIPLFLFMAIVPFVSAASLKLGGILRGTGEQSFMFQVQQMSFMPPAMGGGFYFGHLWFLYYLLVFYAIALALRALVRALDRKERLALLCDLVLGSALRYAWAPLLFAVPFALWFLQLDAWNESDGIPTPFGFALNASVIVGYGIPFGVGWLLQRQVPLVLGLQRQWVLYLVVALLVGGYCLTLLGLKPGTVLHGTDHVLFVLAYGVGMWSWILGLISTAVRFLSEPRPLVRYLADASYWIYLMHLAVMLVFISWLQPSEWYWGIKLLIILTGSVPILFISYHYLVRSTWMGVLLNGRRRP